MQKTMLVAMIALLSACSKDAASPAVPADGGSGTSRAGAAAAGTPDALSGLSAQGIGPIRFGMTLDQAEAASGSKAERPTPFDPACSMVRLPALPKLRFMVENGVVTRADAEAGVSNALGINFGDTLAQIRDNHPEAEVTPHKYDENGHYVTFPSADGAFAVILEESGGKIVKMRAGRQPAVAYVETCG